MKKRDLGGFGAASNLGSLGAKANLGNLAGDLGAFGDQSGDDRARGEQFFADYSARGYLNHPQDEIISYYDSLRPSFIESLGAQMRVGGLAPLDLGQIYATLSVRVAPYGSYPDPALIESVVAAQPGSLEAVVQQASAQTYTDVVNTAKVVGAVAGTGAIIYGVGLLVAAFTAVKVLAAEKANPRRKRSRKRRP